MTIHQNLIAGEWTGTRVSENINPSDTNEVVGRYAQASARMRRLQSPPRRPLSRPGRARHSGASF